MPVYYRHLGRVPVVAAVLGPVVVAAGAVFVGGMYGFLAFIGHLIPFPRLMLIAEVGACGAAGVFLGRLAGGVMVGMKARSRPATVALAVGAGLVGLYAAWMAWVYVVIAWVRQPPELAVLARPTVLWRVMRAVNETGYGVMKDVTLSGWSLAVCWMGEAGLVMGMAVMAARTRVMARVFCEGCGKWGEVRELVRVKAGEREWLRAELLAGRMGALRAAGVAAIEEDQWCEVSLEGCTGCDGLQALTMSHNVFKRERRGSSVKIKVMIHRLLLQPEQVTELLMTAAALNAPEPESLPDQGAARA